ncbi:MAG: uroporphyrinogen-III synthase, partial [Nitrospinota bacterium]
RSREQASEFARRLEGEGAEVIEFPTIELLPPESYGPLDEAIGRLKEFGWIIFTSANGVRFFSKRLEAAGLDSRALSGVKLCAIGPGTADALGALGLRADLVPGDYRAEGIVEGLGREDLSRVKVLIPRAERARDLLPEELKKMGALVEVIPAYRTLPSKGTPEEHARLMEELKQGKIDMVTFTSSSTVENFLSALPPGEAKELTEGVVLAAIGPITARRAEELGLKVSLAAERYTIEAFSEAIINFFTAKR